MSFTTLQNTPLEIDLVEQGKTTGWEVNGTTATHELCNTGDMYQINYPMTLGSTYTFTYQVNSISGGYLKAYVGDTEGATVTTTGFKEETLQATGTDLRLRFYATAALSMQIFNIKEVLVDTGLKKTNVTAWSEKNNKWSDFRTSNPDCAFSMFINLYSFKQGVSYVHKPNSGSRNNFYDTQYQTIINIPFNQKPAEIKTYQGISIQNNLLMITTTDGIETSLGQISDLAVLDFLKYTLDDGVDTLNVYSKEGVYSTSFLRDKNEDLFNGAPLKGSYITVELITAENGVLKLESVAVHSERSAIGVR